MNKCSRDASWAKLIGVVGLLSNLWGVGLALAWLLPNRYWPWDSFWADYWSACCFWIGSALVLLSSRDIHKWPWVAIFVLALAIVPFFQNAIGIILFSGEAIVSFLYLFGLAFSIFTGYRLEILRKNKAADILFFSVCIAAIASVGMQLSQWLGLDVVGFWVLPSNPSRPSANFSQPNNLATFLFWAVLASAWAYNRNAIGAGVAALLIFYFAFGIALTQSRMAVLGLLMVVVLSIFFRRVKGGLNLICITIMALVTVVLSLLLIPVVSNILMLPLHENRFSDAQILMHDDIRLSAYRLFFVSLSKQPWLGYGWASLGEAFFSSLDSISTLGVVFGHSHNLFLDLMLWVGVPGGLIISAAIVVWLYRVFFNVNSLDKAILFLFLAFVGWHAMLELPLHYANFLLPCGLVVGVLEAKNNPEGGLNIAKWPLAMCLIVAVIGLWAVGRDYFLVEENARSLRLERLSIGTGQSAKIPNLIVLNQLGEFLEFSRFEVRPELSDSELQWASSVVQVIYNPTNTLHFVEILALNGRENDARLWIDRLQKIQSKSDYEGMHRDWQTDSAKMPLLRTINWPAVNVTSVD